MFKIVRKKELNSAVTLMEIEAPFVAKKAKAGQFIIFRVDETGERVPLTIAGYDREKGTVAIIFQKVGLTTKMLGAMNEGDYIQDFVGPLGKPTNTEGIKRVCVVGGGVGCAIALPSAQAFKEAGAEVDVIVGFRSKDIVILEDEFKACSDHLYLMTDDGSYGEKGFGTVKLQQLLESGILRPAAQVRRSGGLADPEGLSDLLEAHASPVTVGLLRAEPGTALPDWEESHAG